MLTVIKKISNEINDKNRPEMIESFKDILIDSFDLTSQEKTFYSLPLEIVLEVISKVDFSSFDCDVSLLKTIVKHTVTAHPEEKETLFLLHLIKTHFFPLTLNDCVKILSFFSNSELCIKLGELYNEMNSPSLEVDYDLKLKEKEEEIKSLNSLVSDLKESNERYKDGSKSDIDSKKPDDFEPNIFLAAASGKLSSLQYLIEQEKVDIDQTTPIKYQKENIPRESTILHVAAQFGHFKIVQYLIEKGANIEVQNEFHYSPLHFACLKGSLSIVQYLIEKGANIEAKGEDQRTPLHSACCSGHLPVIQYLIEKGANIEAKDYMQWTPLHTASISEKTDVVRYLVSKGANINTTDRDGKTPLDYDPIDEIRKYLK